MLTITNEDNMVLMARYPDKHFDIAIIDPPYGSAGAMDYERSKNGRFGSKTGRFGKYYKGENICRTGGGWHKKYGTEIRHWDVAPDEAFFNELFRVSKKQIIWGGNYFPLPPSRNFIVWRKITISEAFSMAMVELAWTNIRGNAKYFECMPQGKDRFHPTEKPVELYSWLLSRYCKPGWKILDTHMGSGTIAIACHNAGFDLTACEIDKVYFDKAMERINKHIAQQDLFDKKEMFSPLGLFEDRG